jgi:hypothetical protein
VIDEKESIIGIIAQADIAIQMRNAEAVGKVVKEISEV